MLQSVIRVDGPSPHDAVCRFVSTGVTLPSPNISFPASSLQHSLGRFDRRLDQVGTRPQGLSLTFVARCNGWGRFGMLRICSVASIPLCLSRCVYPVANVPFVFPFGFLSDSHPQSRCVYPELTLDRKREDVEALNRGGEEGGQTAVRASLSPMLDARIRSQPDRNLFIPAPMPIERSVF